MAFSSHVRSQVDAKLWPVLQRDPNVTLEEIVEVVQDGGLRKVWAVVLLREVGQGDALCRSVDDLREKSSCLVVREVAAWPANALLQGAGVGSILEESSIIIRFDGNVFAPSDVAHKFVGP